MNREAREKKTIKAWAVVWTKESYSIYRSKGIIGCETEVTIRKRLPASMKFKTIPVWADYVLFKTLKGAKDFAQGNKDWKTIKCEILVSINTNRE